MIFIPLLGLGLTRLKIIPIFNSFILQASEQEASELLGKKDSINLTENPVEFNLNPSSFSRSLLKGKRRTSSASSCSENAAFAGGSEVAPFFENGTESKKVVENVLVEQPEDRYVIQGHLLPFFFLHFEHVECQHRD